MQNSKKTTQNAPNLGELQKAIDNFFMWKSSNDVRESLFDIYSYAQEAKFVREELDEDDRLDFAFSIKLINELLMRLEQFTTVPRV